ncbi:MAG: isf-10 [Candidatus Saganbacteria bacterium]|uniref:Isf-10 n=1 Tax=Candidatus Saganbacteria bacterium TaxID=2575572 RepID=A0A833L009_UNCSA|nr:MAG: isf-10 [Candidatus Saganbacteria bacterium]
MLEMPAAKGVLSTLFYYLANQYDSKHFPNFAAVYQFILTESEEVYSYYISISNGKAEYFEGKHSSPTIKIHAPVSVWLDLSSGRLNGLWGFITGKYHVEGPLSYLRQMRKVFGKKFNKSDISEIAVEIEDYEIEKKRQWKKPDRVLVINGSPHQENGDTYFYLSALIGGLKKAGAEVELINIYNKNLKIEPCDGCLACWRRTDGVCVIKDDANMLLDKVAKAYLTIYALPLYVESVPAKLKAFLDRNFIFLLPYMMPYHGFTRHPGRERKEQYLALFSVSGFPEIEHFKSLVEMFKGAARNSHKPLIAAILRPGAEGLYSNPFCYKGLREILASLEQAGQELVEKGKVSQNILKSIAKNYLPLKTWREGANLHWYLKTSKQ